MDGQERQAEQKAQETAVQKETAARQEPERAEGVERTQERSGQAAEKGDVQAEFDRMIRGEYREAFERRAGALLAERMQGLRQENQQLRRRSQRQRMEAAEHLLRLRDSEERMREKYPGFCWQREMADPAFGRLVLAGVEPEAAYAAVHRQELLEAAMRYAAGRTRRQVASSLASGGRARENGGRSAAVSRSDPRGLNSRELADIRKRVMEGERISF